MDCVEFKESKGSKRGQKYTAATGEYMMNLGENTAMVDTGEGKQR